MKLYEIIDDPKHDKLYLITEFVKNGNLFQKVTGKTKPNQGIMNTLSLKLTED